MNHSHAVLMDIDGTLLASADAQASSWLRVLTEFGYAVKYGQVRARIGMGQDRLLRELCGLPEDSPRARRILAIRELHLRSEYLPKLELLPGVHEFLARLAREGREVVIATSASRSEAMALLGHAQLLTDFDHVMCKEDAAQTKPAADIVRTALERAGILPENAVFVASSPYDLGAAHAAHVPSIALRSGGWPDSALLDATDIYDDLRQLLARFDSSPLSADALPAKLPRPFLWREPALWPTAPVRKSHAA
ncbi:MAG TPA: HAD family hydrolase [Polyangiaceae bacterium]|jgi:HAD superfamily hydrolase (TIGR01509 family)|nr:HAD family hydrolase [Polyangiaceae bacterium]